jgi:glycosyltransferase involved in cell wall biosynthesis
MRVLFHHFEPFSMAHGGLQIQIERTFAALRKLGVEVDFLRWYDGSQSGDILHFFGRIPTTLREMAHEKGMKVVLAELLTAQGSRSRSQLAAQKLAMRVLSKAFPRLTRGFFNWESYRLADACVALTHWEAHLMRDLFGARPAHLHVVPNGVADVFLEKPAAARQRTEWLVCTATITERKRILELTRAAVQAQTPLWVIGKPYADADGYFRQFRQVAADNPRVIRYEGAMDDPARLAEVYRQARGFVLLSAMESLSLSALEAAACECPLLLSDLPWARTVFEQTVSYCPVTGNTDETGRILRRFYDSAPTLKVPPPPLTWDDVAVKLRAIYDKLLSNSR